MGKAMQKLSALARLTVQVQEMLATLITASHCGTLPEHHTGTENDFSYLQLLSQPKPGPPTLSHQSTSDGRGQHRRRQPASQAHTLSQSRRGCRS